MIQMSEKAEITKKLTDLYKREEEFQAEIDIIKQKQNEIYDKIIQHTKNLKGIKHERQELERLLFSKIENISFSKYEEFKNNKFETAPKQQTIAKTIRKFIELNQNKEFKTKDVMVGCDFAENEIGTIRKSLQRMLISGQISRVKHGVYISNNESSPVLLHS